MMTFHKQKGFSLVSAIFIVVVLAALGSYMVTIGGANRATTSAALQGARAYQAARTGIDWATYTITRAADQATARNNCNNIINPASFSPASPVLVGFNITLDCSFTGHNQQGTDNVTVYRLTAVATSGSYGDADFVQRRISAIISPP